MKKMSRRLSVLCLVAAGASIAACGSSAEPKSDGALGQLALPLTTQGPSGVAYHLRHATFVIRSNGYYYEDAAGAGNSDGTVTVNSDDQPDATSLTVSLEHGNYTVQLLPGWSFEKEGPNGPEPVVATLLSSATQWVWISPRSTSWAEYKFGIGDRAIWLNGKLNIDITVYETPNQYYGGAGDNGVGGSGSDSGGAPDF